MKRKSQDLLEGDLLLPLPVKIHHLLATVAPRQQCQSQYGTCLPCHPAQSSTTAHVESDGADDNNFEYATDDCGARKFVPYDSVHEPLVVASGSSSDDCVDKNGANDSLEANLPLATGLVFEASSNHFDRHNRLHPERPDRITNLFHAISENQDLLSRCRILLDGDENRLKRALVDRQDFTRVHSSGYIQRLERISQCNCVDRLEMEASQYQSVYLTPNSLKEAEAASESLCHLVSRVVNGELRNGFAVIRPPGHHAQVGMAGGYCLINHVAVAASYAHTKLGLSKILIVDWDVHHGNGTQEIFYDNPNVMYISLHRWDVSNFFPFSANGGPTHVGKDRGIGFNVNVGWNRKGMGDAEYLVAWNRLVMPLAREFNPDLVLVSAGFDAAQGDVGECNVTPSCFGKMTQMLMSLAGGRVVCTLEGGYKRSILTNCVLSVLQALTEASHAKQDESQQEYGLDDIDDAAVSSMKATMTALRPYWKCLQVADEISS